MGENDCPFRAVPFGWGPRRCAGQQIARCMLKKFFHCVLKELWEGVKAELWMEKSKLKKEIQDGTSGEEGAFLMSGDLGVGDLGSNTGNNNCTNIEIKDEEITKVLLEKYLRPDIGHKYSGRTNDGKIQM